MIKSILIFFTIFLLVSCSKDTEVRTGKIEYSWKSKQVEVKTIENQDYSYERSIDRSWDENLPIHKYEYSENSNIILVSLRYWVSYKKFEWLIQSKSWKVVSKYYSDTWDYYVELSPQLIEFITPPCIWYSTDERSDDYFSISGFYWALTYPPWGVPRESCDTYYMRRNEEKQSWESSWSIQDMSNSEWLEKQTWLPLAVTVKSTENYNGMQVAERQILLISKDEVSFDDMKRVIEWKGWKLLANNFNLYQVDVSNQGESLDEILRIAETMPEVEVASVNSISSPN